MDSEALKAYKALTDEIAALKKMPGIDPQSKALVSLRKQWLAAHDALDAEDRRAAHWYDAEKFAGVEAK